MKTKYVFIVGLPRTGSKLMMNVLANYRGGDCKIAPENFFLGRPMRAGVQQQLHRFGDLTVDANVQRLVDAMYTDEFHGKYWRGLATGSLNVPRQAMLNSLLATDRSPKAIYTTLLHVYTEVQDGTILGDKSGPHLYHVPTLLEWFPEAKIVHTFRDPRAVLASHIKHDRDLRAAKQRGALKRALQEAAEPFLALGMVVYVTAFWLRAARLHRLYQARYPRNYYLSKFEDLVSQPERSVRELCQFLEIEFDPAMLLPPKIGSSYRPDGDVGFDKQTLSRWKKHLQPWMSAWLTFWTKPYLNEFGYLAS